VDSISDNSDSELFPGDVSGSEYMGTISESETSDYTSEDESFPPSTKILKENQNQEVKQQPRKRHKQKRERQVQGHVAIQTAVQVEQKLYITWSNVTGKKKKLEDI